MKDYEQIESLFHLARDLPREQQKDFLLTKTQDQELIGEVMSLLRAENTTTFSNAVRKAAENLYETADDAFIGQDLGIYTIIEKIGAGGMGCVYKAKRNDGVFEKDYAIKIVKKGMDTDEIVTRFNLERAILAKLSYPSIAAVIDGGATDDGRPYFVMEYVDGISITQYCAQHKLSIAARIELFSKVCEVVHYAHQNLIVHRDLKPSNILVTQEGNIKLLDFGIGKLLGQAEDQDLTSTNMMLYTPAYAAPEQILHTSNASTSIDVYALGVILFELLIGIRPFDNSNNAITQNAITDRITPKPSQLLLQKVIKQAKKDANIPDIKLISQERSTHASALLAKLKGDIDLICLKAMHNEPSLRYASVDQLSNDLQRFLNLMPIHARPDSFRYRISKLFARNKQSFIASGIAFICVVTTISFYTIELRSQRDKAQFEQARTQEVVSFITQLFRNVDPNQGQRPDITAKEVLEVGAQNILLELNDRPAVLSQLSTVLGEIFYELGEMEQSAQQMKKVLSVNQANALNRIDDLISAHLVLGFVEQKNGHVNEALAFFETAEALVTAEFGAMSIEHHEVMMAKANLTFFLGEPENALVQYKAALDVIEQVVDPRQALPYSKNLIAYAGAFRELDQFEEAERLSRKALSIQRGIYEFEHLDVLSTKLELASILRDTGKFEESQALFNEVIEGRTKLLGHEHLTVLNAWNSYSQLLDEMGKHEQAAEALETAIKIALQTGNFDVTTLGYMYHNLGLYYKNAKRHDEAIASALLSIKAQNDGGIAPLHFHRYYPIYEIGVNYMYLDDFEVAQKWFEDTLVVLRHNFDNDHRRILNVRSDLAYVILEQQRYDEAEAHLLDIIPAAIAYYGIERTRVQIMIERLMWVYERTSDQANANIYRDMLSAEFKALYYPTE